jgi:hypothetical protein
MYPDVHLLTSKLITVGEVRVTTEDPRTPLMSINASVLVDSVGPPSAEVCRAAASFP